MFSATLSVTGIWGVHSGNTAREFLVAEDLGMSEVATQAAKPFGCDCDESLLGDMHDVYINPECVRCCRVPFVPRPGLWMDDVVYFTEAFGFAQYICKRKTCVFR